MRFFDLRTLSVAILLASAPALSMAQDPSRRPLPPNDSGRRVVLEQRFRQKNEQFMRDKLKLNDDQMKQLRALDARMGPRRGALMREMQTTQMQLQQEISRGDAADQNRVSQLMNQSMEQRKRLMELADEEHRALGKFLTPVQTAQYISYQTQLRGQVQRKLNERRSQEGRPERDRKKDDEQRKGGKDRD